MNILVTGGAGYIGSALVKELIKKKHKVTIIDNLSNGRKELIDSKAIFYNFDLMNKEKLRKVCNKEKFDTIIHLASYKAAGESMNNLSKYSQNIITTINILDCMVEYKIKKIIFSSSAGVYGEPQYIPIDEKHPTNPINYYGFTKLENEKIIKWYSQQKGIIGICLRYFNVIGDAGLGYTDPNAQNIEPIIKEVKAGKRKELIIFGNDYDTPDGTCIRDYIHIQDLIQAHILAIKLNKSNIINLGSGKGISVLELAKTYNVKYKFGPRRKGDPSILTASNNKAKKILGWKPTRLI